MLLKTHFALAILIILLFLQQVNSKIIFIIMVLVASVVPDLDSPNSVFGKFMIFRPVQNIFKHRGILHSLTLALLISLGIAVFFPIASFGFFLGYGIHLFADAFTKDGIKVFWPLKFIANGPLHTGGKIEESIFFLLIFINMAVFFILYIL